MNFFWQKNRPLIQLVDEVNPHTLTIYDLSQDECKLHLIKGYLISPVKNIFLSPQPWYGPTLVYLLSYLEEVYS